MAKKRKRVVSQNDAINLLELRLILMAHCKTIKAVSLLLSEGKIDAAIARLEGAGTVLQATVRGQCYGQTMKCPKCGTEQDFVAWVDDGTCEHCGGTLEMKDS